jgi:small subunit ribosomal protein S13
MAEPEKPQEKMKKPIINEAKLIRILSKDIPGDKKLYIGLQRIKGVSWSFSNAVCTKLKIDKNRKIEELSEKEITDIQEFIKNPDLPACLLNRRKDPETGKAKHLHGSDLDLQRDFDIKKLKKIKSFKGMRHTLGQPVRGQRTKSHFRTNKKKSGGTTGIVKKKAAPAAVKTKPDTKK